MNKEKKVKKNLKYFLRNKLNKEELEQVNRSFRIFGNIATVEISDNLNKKEKIIGETILKMNKGVSTVLRILSGFKTNFRVRKTKVIAGKKTKKVLTKENGCFFEFDFDKVFFSGGTSTERKRIASLVKKNEKVLVMFSGCAPYNCVISKHSEAKVIYGVEFNKFAHESALKNVELNKLKNVKLFQNDVGKFLPKLNEKFDRIVMPCPGYDIALSFLGLAIKYTKKNGTIHFYLFVSSEEDFKHVCTSKVGAVFSAFNKEFKITKINFVGDKGPRLKCFCVDIKIL